MSVANSSKKPASSQHDGFVWAGAMARMRRAGNTARVGRRSALLGVLTAAYANTSRPGRPGDGRTTS